MLLLSILSKKAGGSFIFQHDGGAVAEQFRGTGGNGTGSETNVQNCIGSHSLGLLDHSAEGFATAFVEKFGIALEFATDEVFETCRNIAPDMLCPHRTPLNETKNADNSFAGDKFCIDDEHEGSTS